MSAPPLGFSREIATLPGSNGFAEERRRRKDPPMSMMVNVFNPSLALLTDLYQVTMAYGYWKNGVGDREAVFHLYFRKPPFNGGYAIASGLQSAIDFIKKLQFGDGDIGYLAQLQGN